MTSTVNSKGRVTIPKKVRDRLGIRAGSAVAFELNVSGEIVLRCVAQADGQPASVPMSRFAKLRGRATVKMRTEEILALPAVGDTLGDPLGEIQVLEVFVEADGERMGHGGSPVESVSPSC